MRDVDLLVRAAFLYPMSEGLPIVADGEVAIAAGRIVHAGPRQPEGTWRARRIIGGPRFAALPGFVNSHCHTASIIFRSQTDDHAARSALFDVAFRASDKAQFRGVVADVHYGATAPAGSTPAPKPTQLRITPFELRWQ